jgi:hypothetical protein
LATTRQARVDPKLPLRWPFKKTISFVVGLEKLAQRQLFVDEQIDKSAWMVF